MTNHFLQGAMILLLAGMINRILGFLYQIAVIRYIGPEIVGLFNMAFPIYVMLLVLASAGIPLAVAKLVAEHVAKRDLAGAYKTFKVALVVLLGTSMFFTLIIIVASPLIKTYIFPNPSVYYCFIFLIPGIMIVSICSVFRGFFQGLQLMTPTAVSQIFEQATRVTTGLIVAYLLLPKGVEYAAAGLSVGVVLGELVGFFIILRIYFTRKPPVIGISPIGLKVLLQRMFHLAIPVTITRFVATAFLSIQAVLIPRRLVASGMSLSEATGAYGQFVGIAEALLFIPGVVTISLATALVPAMSDALALRNQQLINSRITEAMRVTIQIGLPMATIFLLLPRELCGILFGYPDAGISLQILAISGPFLYLQQATTGILQGIGKAEIPCKNLTVASICCLVGIYFTTSVPWLNIKGSAMSVGAGYILMSLLNIIQLQRLTGFKLNSYENVIKPLVSAIAMLGSITYVKYMLSKIHCSEGLLLLLTLIVGCTTYLVLMILIGGFTQDDKNKLKLIFRL